MGNREELGDRAPGGRIVLAIGPCVGPIRGEWHPVVQRQPGEVVREQFRDRAIRSGGRDYVRCNHLEQVLDAQCLVGGHQGERNLPGGDAIAVDACSVIPEAR